MSLNYHSQELMLDEDQSFSLTANITALGYQTIVPRGYLVSRRNDGTYVAPLIPELFYGADGTQLTTWSQNFTATGNQVVLSRNGGMPSVPRGELYWRKISEPRHETRREQPVATTPTITIIPTIPSWVGPALVIGGLAFAGLVIYGLVRR